ncbi:type II toxin-antitoxin system VapC family toxin [Gluconacetobacter takamatsuzukensis]|uniref:type II toxin-antitoxin system VapC family toxin n=1 Tax=Gluconacetobacter takamatsuzukensis TaxID=1286190 RepID=UPI0030844903
MAIVPFSSTQAALARQAFLRFGKDRHPAGLNFGDCASYALARERNLPLLFKGDDFSQTDLTAVA